MTPILVRNLEWLKALGPLDFAKQDVRDARGTADVMVKHRDADVALHLAGQVAVTTSVTDPGTDFEINPLGTLTCWRPCARAVASPSCCTRPPTRSTATGAGGVELRGGRYAYKNLRRPSRKSSERRACLQCRGRARELLSLLELLDLLRVFAVSENRSAEQGQLTYS